MANDCVINKKNMGTGRCTDLPSAIRGIITTPADFKLTEAQISSQTVWQDAITDNLSSRIYLWPLFATVPEDISTETVYEDNPVSYDHVLDGRYRFKAMIAKSLCFHKAAFTHRGKTGRVWLIDAKNSLIGTYVGNDNYAGFTLDLLNTENLKFNDGSVSSKTPIIIALKDPNEINDSIYGAFMFKVGFLNLLSPLTDAVITKVTDGNDTTIVVSVSIKCDKTPISGLDIGDFVVTETNGTLQTLTSVVENPSVNGQYTLTKTGGGLLPGFVSLTTPKNNTLYPGAAYEVQVEDRASFVVV